MKMTKQIQQQILRNMGRTDLVMAWDRYARACSWENGTEEPLDEAFDWGETEEGFEFWEDWFFNIVTYYEMNGVKVHRWR